MDVKTLLDIAGYLLAFVGFLATLYKTVDVWINLRRFSWKEVDKLTKKLIRQISDDMFVPDVIVGIGRGGSILGALLSGNLRTPGKNRNVPLLVVDRIYEWINGERVEVENKMIDFSPLAGKKVLLVAGDVLTGGTMKFFLHEIESVGVKEIKTACLVKGVASTYHPDYFGKEITGDFHMPWMYKGYGYVRDSRKPPRPKRGKAA